MFGRKMKCKNSAEEIPGLAFDTVNIYQVYQASTAQDQLDLVYWLQPKHTHLKKKIQYIECFHFAAQIHLGYALTHY